ncbi:hypothetical protein BST63_36220 [Bradyrhizobium canariense]|uniref:Uncharacterized protein n=1 Tax=Bradyrhizobium canariense TaxID=255045 RepID=A0ABX3WST6_9BRAD|nr:hypothetical protein BSR47_31175 [Bradyrhizobium canariense]OSJ21152.1 hypothetical protein BST63_36220 [Bradyrhizobium canariense]
MGETTMVARVESKRQWVSGLAITLTALVCLFAFWHLSPGLTFIIAICSLTALVALFWVAGADQ